MLRHERKFFVEWEPAHALAALRSHPALFREIHRERRVNNIYLDSIDRTDYRQNVAGTAERRKFRLRWYGDTFGAIESSTLEIKRKLGYVGEKDSFAFGSLELVAGASPDAVRALFLAPDLPLPVKEDLALREPTLLNTYRRRYFLTADRRFRATLDWELRYRRLGAGPIGLVPPIRDERHVVVELKYEPENDRDAAAISSKFRFRLTRSSKYVMGLDAIDGTL